AHRRAGEGARALLAVPHRRDDGREDADGVPRREDSLGARRYVVGGGDGRAARRPLSDALGRAGAAHRRRGGRHARSGVARALRPPSRSLHGGHRYVDDVALGGRAARDGGGAALAAAAPARRRRADRLEERRAPLPSAVINRETEGRHGFAATPRALGVWGPFRGPYGLARSRGAARLRRDAPK